MLVLFESLFIQLFIGTLFVMIVGQVHVQGDYRRNVKK